MVNLANEHKGLAGRSDEIDNFQNLLRQIETAYIASLNLANNADERIRSEFAGELASHAQIVSDQEQVRREKDTTAAATEQLNKTIERADADTARAEQAEKRAKELEQNLIDKEKLNAVLADQVSELKTKISTLDAELSETRHARDDAEQAKRHIEELKKELERQAEQSKVAVAAAYEKGKSDGKQERWSYFKEQLDAINAERKELIDKLTKE